jgi:hypothetical protein
MASPSLVLAVTAGELTLLLDSCGLRFIARPGGAGFRAQCPAHDDGPKRRRWSLVISERPDGQRVLHCFAGCQIREIREALALPIEAFDGWQGYSRACGASSTDLVSSGSSGHLLRKTTLLGHDLALQLGFRPPELLAAHAHGDLIPWAVWLALPPRSGAAMRSVVEHLQLLFGLCLAAGLERPAIAYGGEYAARDGVAGVENVLARLVAGGAVVRLRPPRAARPKARLADGGVFRGRPARAAMYAMGEGAVVAAPGEKGQQR